MVQYVLIQSNLFCPLSVWCQCKELNTSKHQRAQFTAGLKDGESTFSWQVPSSPQIYEAVEVVSRGRLIAIAVSHVFQERQTIAALAILEANPSKHLQWIQRDLGTTWPAKQATILFSPRLLPTRLRVANRLRHVTKRHFERCLSDVVQTCQDVS